MTPNKRSQFFHKKITPFIPNLEQLYCTIELPTIQQGIERFLTGNFSFPSPENYGIIFLYYIPYIKEVISMKRIGAILLGIWLIFTGILGMDLISLSGVLAEVVDKGLPVLAIIAGIFLLFGK
jgi:hypothetical protein